MYVSNNSSSNAYTINSASVVHFYKDFTFPLGSLILQLSLIGKEMEKAAMIF